MEPTAIIYGLLDPNGILRYVGKTVKSMHLRFRQHISEARRGICNRRCNWIRSLLNKNQMPGQIFIEQVSGTGEEEEIFYVASFRSVGALLTNGTDGGDQVMYGKKHTDEAKAKMRKAHQNNPSVGEKNSMYGKKHSPETREKMKKSHNHLPRTSGPLPASQIENMRKARLSPNLKGLKTVQQLDVNGNVIATYPSARIAAEQFGYPTRCHIDDVCRGTRKLACGFRWRYV